MTKVSVEYAHIYTNQQIAEEHQVSLQVLSGVTQELENAGKSSSLVVLVDDYSFPDPSFDYSKFSEWLETQGFKPDLLFRESQLIPVCDEVLSLVNDTQLKTQINDYIRAKKYPCSLFIAAWYLLRLGKIQSQLYPVALQSDELINILPESFKPFEDKGLEIIKATKFANAADSISYKFLPGRLIAV
ncbi:hypothetical protein EPO04_02250 [Patescibacteria group bacterium]|nr:MAG: hypothetical protein EPO04_02250 [Patescibacteria group bacterium]